MNEGNVFGFDTGKKIIIFVSKRYFRDDFFESEKEKIKEQLAEGVVFINGFFDVIVIDSLQSVSTRRKNDEIKTYEEVGE